MSLEISCNSKPFSSAQADLYPSFPPKRAAEGHGTAQLPPGDLDVSEDPGTARAGVRSQGVIGDAFAKEPGRDIAGGLDLEGDRQLLMGSHRDLQPPSPLKQIRENSVLSDSPARAGSQPSESSSTRGEGGDAHFSDICLFSALLLTP